jgi:hypothetical protein
MMFYVCSRERVASRVGLSGRSKLHLGRPAIVIARSEATWRSRSRKAHYVPLDCFPRVPKPGGRNDDRGSNQLQFARVFFLSPTGSREGFVTARNSQPPRPEAPRRGLEGRFRRRQRGDELDHPSRREAWLRSLRHEAVRFGVVRSSILGVAASRESAAKVLK